MTQQQSFLHYLECRFQDEILIFGRNKWVKWSIFYGLWTILAILFATEIQSFSESMGESISWLKAVVRSISFFYIWAFLSLFILALGRYFPLEKSFWQRSLPIHTLACLMLPVIHTALYVAINRLGDMIQMPGEAAVDLNGTGVSGLPFLAEFQALWLDRFASGVLIYWMVLLVGQAILIYQRYQAKQVEFSRLEGQLATARLQALKMQVHPHFLFNTLNSISTLIHKDPDAADRMLSRLSDLLRLTLENASSNEVDLRHEIDFLQRYLEMEQIRFGERFTVRFDIDPELLDAAVPNLILQPLVENAIRHGVAPHSKPGLIEITGLRNNGMLELSVRDNGDGLTTSDVSYTRFDEGVGLSNTRKRLRQLYGDAHRFDLHNAPNGGLIASVSIPFRDRGEHDNRSSNEDED